MNQLTTVNTRFPVATRETAVALSLLSDYGYLPKVFCITESQRNLTESFAVESSKWTWLVVPIDQEEAKMIPREYLQALYILKKSIKINGYALAKPIPKETARSIVKLELMIMANVLAKPLLLMASLAKAGTQGMYKLFDGIKTELREFSDPVLLVRINNQWIEVGRWE